LAALLLELLAEVELLEDDELSVELEEAEELEPDELEVVLLLVLLFAQT
jgi:hypothetical protein